VPGVVLEIVETDGRPVAAGAIGELRTSSDTMVRGYLDDPAADRRHYRNGWFYPGDLACWSEDGQVIFKGRADDMMIFNGINIYPREIEICLQEHPDVLEAISFPLRSERHGDIPAVAVRLRTAVSEDALLGFAREHLGPRAPRRVIVVEHLPRNAAGKPLVRELAALAEESAKV
jgi:acyl-coenzyme A synthetase/AMP-(fatty) acid ligase